ncbi:hypothetical protein ACGF12_23365 [Kitasatospora sp. NPDC048296]|uniref:hypothetical protein n=1 Tax=Kitasatospora sp. NPDC048296 TaxID=3364048 RepID=UPI00371117FD
MEAVACDKSDNPEITPARRLEALENLSRRAARGDFEPTARVYAACKQAMRAEAESMRAEPE